MVAERVGEKRGLEKRIQGLEDEVTELKLDALTTEKAIWLLQQYADFQQKEVIEKIEDLVSSGLQAVFQNVTLQFKLYYSETKSGAKKKAPEITMAVFYDYGGEQVKGDIRNSFGGGLSVVVATLLRVVVVRFLGERVRPILFLDEPLKDLSPEYPDQDSAASGYRDRMADFLKGLTSSTDIQIIMVSHEPNYAEEADVDYRFHGSIGKSPKITKTAKQELDGGM
jgi:DNA repair exonuclease SbcCD ATPase subunit